MKFFVDSADVNEIRDLAATGLVDGVTTNPSLVAKTGRPIKDVIAEICAIVPGPVSAEVTATDYDGMLHEGDDAGGDRQERHDQGAADLGRAPRLPDAQSGGPQGQRHALLLVQSGAARRQGRRDLHFAVHRPPRRHRLTTGMELHPRHPRDLRQLPEPHDRDLRGLDAHAASTSSRRR